MAKNPWKFVLACRAAKSSAAQYENKSRSSSDVHRASFIHSDLLEDTTKS
jgi:hypothetical protein